ncbi:SCF ubiquitin ligase complex subunit [Xylographa pallens]|nr:SCF ubiquitin ligase complex subunit [Xylographa pallens]
MEHPNPSSDPSVDDSASSSTPSTPGQILDDEPDFALTHNNDSQSSFGASSSREQSVQPPSVRSRPKYPIEHLPPELLIYIISKLSSPSDILRCLKVSKAWSDCCVELLWHRPLFTTWERLVNVVNSIQDSNAHWRYADLIKRLNLSNLSDQINDGTLQPFVNCRRIERLTLTSCSSLTDSGIIGLVRGNRQLLALDITGLHSITDLTVAALAHNCPRLQGLNITNCRKVTDASLVTLAENCKYLKRLKLNKCTMVTDESIEAFARRCPSMLEIDLQDCRFITDHSVTSLMLGGRQLRELRLASCSNITDDAFLQLPSHLRYDSLRILDLTACHQLTDLAVERIIEGAPRLRILVLAKCVEITDRSVMAITKLGKNLHDIHLGRCQQISDDALKELVKACNRIRYIDLAGCHRVTDAAVEKLAQLPKLRRIGLVKCQAITDDSINALAGIRRGERSRNNVATNLERVHLSYCVRITLGGIKALLNHCPKLTHLSLTGIQAFFLRDDLIQFCREAPAEFNEEQRTVFCVFSGDGVSKLRKYLNEDHFDSEINMYEEGEMLGDDGDADGILGLMQSTGLDAEDGDGDEFDVDMQ